MLRSGAAAQGPELETEPEPEAQTANQIPIFLQPQPPRVSMNHLKMVIVSGFPRQWERRRAKSQRDSGENCLLSQQVILSNLAMFTSPLDITRDLMCRIWGIKSGEQETMSCATTKTQHWTRFATLLMQPWAHSSSGVKLCLLPLGRSSY